MLPRLFLSWIFMGIWNFLTSKLVSLFGVKPENNPFRMQFHYGYALREDSTPVGYKRNGNNGNNGRKRYINNNGWENGLTRELYGLD